MPASPMPASWGFSRSVAHRAASPAHGAPPPPARPSSPASGALTPRHLMSAEMGAAFDREMSRAALAAAAPAAPAAPVPAEVVCSTCAKRLPPPVAGEGDFHNCPYCKHLLPQGEDAKAAARLNADGRAYVRRIGCDPALFARTAERDPDARKLYLTP
jgi:hypothetical protein